VLIANTGGWVVDRSDPLPSHGGSAVLISEELDVASINLFTQTADGRGSPITIEGNSPWADELRQVLDFGRQPWSSLAANSAQAVKERHALAYAYEHQY
jgi:hypothetical protein